MVLKGLVAGTFLVFGSLIGWPAHPGAWAPVWPVDDCWNCNDCGNGSHQDELPFLEDGESMGGTFVNMCNTAYSYCPGATHEPCEQTDQLDGLTFSIDHLDQLENVVARGDADELRVTLKLFERFARLNVARAAVEVIGCDGTIFASLPIRDAISADLNLPVE